jgi:hypothetical protein
LRSSRQSSNRRDRPELCHFCATSRDGRPFALQGLRLSTEDLRIRQKGNLLEFDFDRFLRISCNGTPFSDGI